MSDDGIFDAHVALTYDSDSAEMFASDTLGPAVEFLAGLAGDHRVLEFAVGTGRVALALSGHGLDVAGIELSRAMAQQMQVKPGADRVQLVIGDMAMTRVEGTFGLVYLVYDVANQVLTSHHYRTTDGRARSFDSQHRFAWPAEYDLMARIAGLELAERWSDWRRAPFTSDSTSHVSVWRKPR